MRLVWPLIGRSEEMRTIEAAISAPDIAGIVVRGPAGVGKSRIAREALSAAASHGCETRWAVGTSSARAIPLSAFTAWAQSGVTDTVQLLRGAIESLTAASSGVTVVVAVDDVHLLDDLSTFVVHQIVQRGAAKVILTARDGEPISSATTEIWKAGQFDRLNLPPLSIDETTALLSATLRGTVDPHVVQRLWTLTRGNVLYLRNIVEQGVADGSLAQQHGYWRWTGDPVMPPSLIELEEADSCASSSPDRTALVMGGGTVDKPDDYLVGLIKNQYIEPTHPGADIAYCPVTTPMEAFPITGFVRVLGIAFGPPEVWGPGGAGWWPDAPWWKNTGLFDPTVDQAVQIGVSNLEHEMALHGNDHLVIYGISEGSLIAVAEKRKLAEQYPEGTDAPDIDFVMQATFNLPNGGLHARFPGLKLPIGWTFDGPAPTDTQFDTVVINRQYDGIADFPLYPINVIADLNAMLGTVYVHTYSWDVSLPADDPTESPAYQDNYGDTSYYFFENPDLPLFGPLRTLGVPEPLIDVFEPFFRVIVELGYDRSIKPWEPTPARLIPRLNPVTVAGDLVNAIGEGINNALAITGSPAPPSVPAAPAIRIANVDVSNKTMSVEQVTETEQATSLEQRIDADQAALREPETETEQVTSLVQRIDADQAALRKPETEPEQAKSKNFSIFNPAKRSDRAATHRPVVRDALKAFGQRIHGALHAGEADAPAGRVTAAKDGPGPAGPSSDHNSDNKDADGS